MMGPTIIANDALVVLCLMDLNDSITHHHFKVRAAARGFSLSKSQCHNMLHRATGRVCYNDSKWRLTSAGLAYREEVIETLTRLIKMNA